MKDPMDMELEELKEERKRLRAYPWLDQGQSSRLELVEDLLAEHDEAVESNVKTMF